MTDFSQPAEPARAARTWRRALLAVVAAVSSLPFVSPVGAADLPQRQTAPVTPTFMAQDYFFDEVRIGGYYHGIGNPERDTADVNIEVLTRKVWIPSDPDYAWLAPRLHAGGTINTSNHGTNYGYAVLTWTWDDLLFKHTFAITAIPASTPRSTGPSSAASRCSANPARLGTASTTIGALWPRSSTSRMAASATKTAAHQRRPSRRLLVLRRQRDAPPLYMGWGQAKNSSWAPSGPYLHAAFEMRERCSSDCMG
jgi:hypothetical protein